MPGEETVGGGGFGVDSRDDPKEGRRSGERQMRERERDR